MFTYNDRTGTEISREPMGVKARIAKVFQNGSQTMKDIMDEMSKLTDKDIADFSAWFEQEGYPIKRV